MKSLLLLSVGVVSLLVVPLVSRSQTVVFQDTFASGALSTLNPTVDNPGTPTATNTAYEIGSSKTATATAVASGAFTISTSATGSGYTEAQALFTPTPVTLSAAGEYVEIYYTFTNTANVFNGTAAANMDIVLGLYNSGGSAPTNGILLWNGGLLSSKNTATNGACKGWVGYTADFGYSYASAIASRPAQTQPNNSCQAIGYNSGYSGGANVTTMAAVTSEPALTPGNAYTMHMRITYVNSTTLAITNTLYDGPGIDSPVFSAGGWTGQFGGQTTSPLTMTFDALEVGIRPNGGAATTLPISSITVASFIPTAPTVTGLTNQTVIAGNSVTLNPTVTGEPAPTFQWRTNGVDIAGATSASLPLDNVQYAQNGYVYSLIASNFEGAATQSMTLSVIVTPSITGLGNQSAYVGGTVNMSPTVSGVPTPDVHWQANGLDLVDGVNGNGATISGSATSSLSIANAQSADSGTYSLIASNSAGIVTNSITLTVSASDLAPAITGPADQTVIEGNDATFTATVSGLPTPAVQWLDQTGAPILDATNLTLIVSNVSYSQNSYVYSIVASNSVDSVTNSATLTVIVPPVITSQPTGLTVTNTQSASFTVAATGVPNPAYQWYENGSPISSASNTTATNATFTLATTSPADDGSSFYVRVSNAAGTTNSATVSLTVNSAMVATTLTPANGATGLCYDTPLTVTFSAGPGLGSSGSIKIYNVTNSTTPVDTINAAAGLVQQRNFPGDGQSFSYKTIVISGSTVTIYPHFSVLTSNQTYYVTIDKGTFTDPAGANFTGITDTNVWQFTTKPGGPVNGTNVVVNSDGTGDYLTVQGAVNDIPAGSTTPRVINVRDGLYTEIVDISGRNNITLRGQSRLGTLIGYPNNAAFQAANNGTTHARMAFKVNANDIAIENLTVTNMTPQGGTQAEALMVESGAARCIVNNASIISRQDTILVNANTSQVYFNKSAVLGNFDFIWGGGVMYFDRCNIQNIAGTGSGSVTAARTATSVSSSSTYPWMNPSGSYTANGVSFVGCMFTADASVGNVTLAGGNGTSNNLVSWAGCQFSTNYVTPLASLFNGSYLFWQNQNTDLSNNPVSFSSLTTIGVTNNDPRLLAATNATTWFYGWTPSLAPNILTNPASQTVTAGSPATFTVAATGVPDPTYQWQHAGTNLDGAMSVTLAIPSTTKDDAGEYSVIVTTTAGSVTSSAATLTVNPPSNTAPVFTAPPAGTNITINVGVDLSVSCTATDFDLPAQTLTYSLLAGPSGAAVDSGSGNFTWRPTVAESNSVNAVLVVVADNGTPNLSATNAFTVTVNPLSTPTMGSAEYAAGQFSVSLSGQIGPDYALQSTTNLVSGTWVDVATTNSPASSFTLIDTNAAEPMKFYRIVTGPPLP